MYQKLIACTLILWMGACHPKPPKAADNPWVRKPVNSDETAARLQFCAQLGVAPPTPESEPASEPIESPAPAPVEVVPASTPTPAPVSVSSYVMTVYFGKASSAFKPSKEQTEELQSHLKGAARIEVRSFTDTPNEEKTLLSRALAAKDFLVSQGITPSEVWLNLAGVPPTNRTPEEQAQNRRVEIEVYGGAL